MDDIIQKVKERLLELEAESVELRGFLRTYDKLSAKLLEKKPKVTTPTRQVMFFGGGEGVSSKEAIVTAARAVLRDSHPNPVLIGDLYESLVSKGLNIGGKNPKGNLSAKLAPSDDLIYVKDEGWYYRPQRNEPPDRKLDGKTSGGSIFSNLAKDREAGSGGGP